MNKKLERERKQKNHAARSDGDEVDIFSEMARDFAQIFGEDPKSGLPSRKNGLVAVKSMYRPSVYRED